MKVSLDACLFGALCDVKNSTKILDIGAGTGLLSLMLAQKSQANIDAVELDTNAFLQAQDNIKQSPFSQRIKIHNKSIQAFHQEHPPNQYDTIICNPPFFSDHLKANDPQRNLARHNDTLSFHDLSNAIKTCITHSGLAWLLLPPSEHTRFEESANKNNLYLQKQILFIPRENQPSKLGVWVYGFSNPKKVGHDSITIYQNSNHQYTQDFQGYLRDFYLKL